MSEETQADVQDEGAIYEELKTSILDECRKELKADLRKAYAKTPAIAREDDWNFNEFLCNVGKSISKNNDVREKSYNLLNNKYKAMTQGTDTAGGFTVPEVWESELLSVDGFETVLFGTPRLQPYAMSSDVSKFPVKDQTVSPSGGSTAFNAGYTAGVVAEGDAPGAATQFALKQLTLTTDTYRAYTEVSVQLLQNSSSAIEQILKETAQDELTQQIDYDLFNGNSSNITAIIGHNSAIKVIRDDAGEITWVDLAKMVTRFLPKARSRGIWVVHPYAFEKLLLTSDTSNRSIWLTEKNLAGAPQNMIFGMPVVVSDVCADLGNEADIMLIDPKGYACGINGGVRIAASEHYSFPHELVTYRIAVNVAGKPKLTAPVKLRDGTKTVSPFVVLDNELS